MPAAKQPQDRKPKATAAADDVPEAFSFTLDDGSEINLAPTADVVTPGFIRRNRHTDEADVTYLLIEDLSDDKTLDLIDNMSWSEHRRFHEEFGKHVQDFMGLSLGE